MPSNKSEKFVQYVITSVQKNKGFAAKLKKADNENTEYQSWEILAKWIDLNKKIERKSYGLISASLARTKKINDGTLSIGRALLLLQKNDSNEFNDLEKSPAAARLRRLLACRESLELIYILRPILRLIESKDIAISYAHLLDEILWFNNDLSRERIRTHWAQDFFNWFHEDTEKTEEGDAT